MFTRNPVDQLLNGGSASLYQTDPLTKMRTILCKTKVEESLGTV